MYIYMHHHDHLTVNPLYDPFHRLNDTDDTWLTKYKIILEDKEEEDSGCHRRIQQQQRIEGQQNGYLNERQ